MNRECDEPPAALGESEATFSAIFEQSPLAMALTKMPEGVTVRVNRAFEDLLGFPREKLLGRTSLDLGISTPAEQDQMRALYGRQGCVRGFACTRTAEGGRQLVLSLDLSPVNIGGHQHVLTTITDITKRTQAEAALRESESKYRRIVETTAEGVLIGRPDGVIEYVNRQMADMLGYTVEELLGKPGVSLLFEGWVPRVMENRAALDAGELLRGEMMLRRKDGAALWTSWSSAPMFDQTGRHVANLTMHSDITERKRADEALRESERRSQALARIAHIAGSQLDVEGILSAIVGAAGEAFGCEACNVALREPEGWRPTHVWNMPETLIGRLLAPDQAPHAELALVQKRPVAVNDDAEATLAVPLIVKGESMGCLFFSYYSRPHSFKQDEIDFAVAIAATLSASLHNAGLYEAQHRIATTLQENLVHPLPHLPGLELAVLSQPASKAELVGGDFHDVFPVTESRVVVLIGDVMGKGIRAAGLTETVRSATRALALVSRSPAKTLGLLNRLLLAEESDQFVSAVVLLLDTTTGRCLLASAGHPPPALLAGGRARLVEPEYGPPLGVRATSYGTREVRLAPGDILVLYTDGLTEARREGELFGERRLLDALTGAPADDLERVVEHLRDTALTFAGTLRDDLEILALRRAGQADDRRRA